MPHHRKSGYLALAAAAFGALAVFPPYDKFGSRAEDPSDLLSNVLLAAVVALAGLCLLSRSRNAGSLLLVGITASVFAHQLTGVAGRIGDPAGIGMGWFMDETAFVLLLVATVLAVMALVRTADVGLGMSMSSGVLLSVGFFLVAVYVVAEIIPLGEVTARGGGAVVTVTWGALFDGDDRISRAGHILGIILTGGSLLLACLVKPLRLGAAVLAGWAMAEMARLVADAVRLLLPKTIEGIEFSGEFGPGLVARAGSLLLVAGVVAAVRVIERRRSAVPVAVVEADEPAHLVAI